MTMNQPVESGATYTAWPLSEVPQWMLDDPPGQAAWLVLREHDTIGWIEAPPQPREPALAGKGAGAW
jgi:hypothetical protein